MPAGGARHREDVVERHGNVGDQNHPHRLPQTVRAGFAVSTGYNLVGVRIAAAGLRSPLVCAILMPVSSATMVVFACGATAWMGRKLSAHGAGESAGPAPRSRFFNSRLIAQEAA